MNKDPRLAQAAADAASTNRRPTAEKADVELLVIVEAPPPGPAPDGALRLTACNILLIRGVAQPQSRLRRATNGRPARASEPAAPSAAFGAQ
jgi:hypothetical protein